MYPAGETRGAVKEARRHDEHGVVTRHLDANRSDVFLLRPYNVALQPRRARSVDRSHDDTRAVGCKRLLCRV